MNRRDLLFIVLGLLLASGAFLVRDTINAFDTRVSRIENYLTQLNAMMQGRQ